jgi:hypothetical protein
VGAGVTGSSTGYLYQWIGQGHDPNLIAGQPQAIRSDEWAVQTGWTISQVEEGLPTDNTAFPGGFDTSVQSDLPSTDWSVAFRPHLLGFLVLPLANAMALKWWLPAFAMMAAVYMFVVTLLPRRPLVGVALATGFFFAPFFQWWYLPITFWPVAWAFFTMAASYWLLRSSTRLSKAVWSAVAGYTAVTMAVGVYVPFIITAAYVVIAFIAGILIGLPEASELGLTRRIRKLLPLLVAGAGAGVVMAVWLATRMTTIERFLNTVYPGHRLEHTGNSTRQSLIDVFSGPLMHKLGLSEGAPWTSNASEASTFLLPGLFVVTLAVWIVARELRARRRIDGFLVAFLALATVVLAYLIVPGWDGLAHLLLLDRTTAPRIRADLGMIALILIVLLWRRRELDGPARIARTPWWVTGIGLAATALVTVVIVADARQSVLITMSRVWVIVLALFLLCVLAADRGWMRTASLSFLVMSLGVGLGVNPLYHGVLDLNNTAIGKDLKRIQERDAGSWVAVGSSYISTAVLVQSGLPGYSGFQGAPSPKMWKQIDPKHKYVSAWNRLANITWVAGSGKPDPRNPAPDQIQMTFDSCSSFAQEHVQYVVSDEKLSQHCMRQIDTVKQGPTTFRVFEVENRPS